MDDVKTAGVTLAMATPMLATSATTTVRDDEGLIAAMPAGGHASLQTE